MQKLILLVLAIVGWATLAVRLYIRITTSDVSPIESTIQFFSYFTILTNLLVTIYCTYHLMRPHSQGSSIFQKPEALTALTVYIVIVGLVYHIVLKPLWNPTGLAMILSEIHHTFVPLCTLALWLLSKEKSSSTYGSLLRWLAYPILYISFVLIRGSYSDFYPYPFLDAGQLGIQSVLVNSAVLFGVMTVFLFIFNLIGKRI